jgi:hypothetical protein
VAPIWWRSSLVRATGCVKKVRQRAGCDSFDEPVVGRACRRMGRFVVHTSPGQYAAARFQGEVLGALGKHWDRAAQGGNATAGQLVRAWLRAERARDLIVLRAHQVSGPALSWLLSLSVGEYLRVWLISPARSH